MLSGLRDFLNKIFKNKKDLEIAGNSNLKLSKVSKKLDKNVKYLKKAFYDSFDVVFYRFEVINKIEIVLIFIEGLVDKDIIDRDVINPIISKESNLEDIDNYEIKRLISVTGIKEVKQISKIINEIVQGNSVMIIEGISKALVINTKGWETRALNESKNEAVIRGPKESFIEDLNINISLLRRKIKNNNLVLENRQLGSKSQTNIALAYIEPLVDKEVLTELRRRLNRIKLASVLDSGYIEQFIEDSTYSPFATVGNTEKPDVVAGKILEGRIAIFVDGSPHVLTVPYLFVETLQTSEDYYLRPVIASVMRFVRVISFLVSLLLPGFYVSLQTFHQEMIPTVLIIHMSGAMEGIPFPTLAEALLMTFLFEVLRESGIRLQKTIGSAISFVGALVIGRAAVEAGLVSSTIVIIIATTAISSFVVPKLRQLLVISRFVFIFLGGVLGLYGITCGLFVLVVHAVSLRSFGVRYTSPITPLDKSGLKDSFLRISIKKIKNWNISRANKE